MSTLRINNIEAQSIPASPTIDEKVKVTNSSGDILVNIDGKTSGITTIGINTTDGNIKFDANSNVLITGILTATTLAGNFTPDSLEIGSNIKLGNAGVITATNFKSGVTNVHNLGLTLTGGQLDVGSNIKIGTAGVVTATSFSGSGANLTNINSTSATGDFSIADKIIHTGDTNTAIRFPAADTFSVETAGSTRLHIHSDGRFRVGTTSQPSGTVGGFQLDMGSYPGTMRLMSGAGASGTESASLAVGGSNHNASIENGANSGGKLDLYNYNSTDGNSSAVSFLNSNSLSIARVLGLNVSHSSRTGALVFMVSSGSHPTEKVRIGSAGQLGIGGANYGTSGQVLTSAGSGSAPTWATPSYGLTHAEQWHLTANADCPHNTDNVLPTNAGTWNNRTQATSHAGVRGSGMTYESNGIFRFPSTGIWKIDFYGYWGISGSDSERLLRSRIQTTVNNSSYSTVQEQAQSIKSDSTYTYQGWFQTFVFDVTSTSNCKCRFVLNPEGPNCYYKASANPPMTGALFMRLGDT